MWWKEGIRKPKSYKFRKRKMNLSDSRFQWRYFILYFGGVGVFSLLAFGLAAYFIHYNYNVFIDFAYIHSPNFVPNLEFERKWMIILLLSCFLGMQVFVAAISLRLLHSLIYPMQVMRKHIKNLTKGDWSQPEIRVRSDNDYQDLVRTYNYFYRTLQRHSNQELQQLMDLEFSKNATRSKRIWNRLVRSKYEQLNGSSLEPEKAHDSHLAS